MDTKPKCLYCGGDVILVASRFVMCTDGRWGCVAPIWGVHDKKILERDEEDEE